LNKKYTTELENSKNKFVQSENTTKNDTLDTLSKIICKSGSINNVCVTEIKNIDSPINNMFSENASKLSQEQVNEALEGLD
jgi:hypothetical protein